MQAYDFNRIAADIEAWIGERLLEPILYFEGGWEYWVQIDFPAYLDVTHHAQFDFRREVAGILPGARLDWLINSQVQPQNPIAVEIKAQTHKYRTADFLRDVQADVDKLQNLPAQYAARMLAVAVDPNAVAQLVERGFVALYQYQHEVAFMMWVR